MSIFSKLAAGAALGLTLLAAGAPAHAVTIIPVSTGPFSLPLDPDGVLPGNYAFGGDTFDYTFTTIGGTYDTLMQIQATKVSNGVAQHVSFQLFKGTPGSGSFVANSGGTSTAATLLTLTSGTYYLEYSPSIVQKEYVTGGITLLQSVPEPAAWGMMLLGIAALGGAMRQRRQLATA